jgi:hypothetical protein
VIIVPPDSREVFLWRRPRWLPPESSAPEGWYAWTKRGLEYLGPAPPEGQGSDVFGAN